MDHIDGAIGRGSQMALYITGDANTTVAVTVADGSFSQTYPVVAGNILTVNIPSSAFLGDIQGQFLKGIHIVSQKPIAVYAHIYASSVSGATLLLPVNTLGKSYTSINFIQKSNSLNDNQERKPSYSVFTVIGTEDNTTVEITPASNLKGGQQANIPFNIVLKQGEVFQGLALNDLTGTRIRTISTDAGSCKKVAVFSGSSKIAIGCNTTYYTSDNLFQQVYPTSSWGKNYVTAPLKGRNYDVFRIILSDPNTSVTLNGAVLAPGQFTNGVYYDFNSNATNFISADKPIQVAQYAVSQSQSLSCSSVFAGDIGDPEMIYLNPTEQTIDHVTLNSTSNFLIRFNYINVVIKTSAVPTFQLDGAPYTSFTVVPQNTTYSYAQISVSAGVHHISAAEGFNAIAYGFGNNESYGYAAGTNLKNLNEFITLKDPLSPTPQTNGCSGVAYKLQLTLPFQTTNIKWDFKNGTVVNDPNPVVKFTTNPTGTKVLYVYEYPGNLPPYTPGDHSVVATVLNPVADDCGSNEDVEFDFNVADYPVAKATFTNACLGQPVTFTDVSETFGNNIKTWLWDFGDGQTSVLQSPTHTYTYANDFKVHLTVTNQNGCGDVSDIIPVHISAIPVADFDFSTPECKAADITFTDKSIPANDPITKWTWDFGDGSPVVEKVDNLPFTHNYPATGTFTVKLTVSNANSCTSDVKQKDIIIHELPVVDFTMPDACTADFAMFTDKSTIADNTEADFTYLWNFGDVNSNAGNPNTSTDKNPKHRFIDAQLNYTVTLTVKSKYGCEVTSSQSFRVNGDNPKADIEVLNPNDLCSNREVFFENRSTVNFGNVTRIEVIYDITDPSTKVVYDHPAFGQQLRHVYPQFTNATQNYQVQIAAFSGDICGDVKQPITITLKGTPIVTFAAVPGICPEKEPIQLTSLPPEGPTGAGVFSGAGVSAGGVFTPAAAGAGTFNIQYIYTSQNACADTVLIPITVYPSPTVTAGNDVLILEGSHITLKPTVSGHNLTYKWVPSTGLDHDDVLNPVATPTETTPYKLIVTSAEGCSASADVTVNVLKNLQIPNTFTPNGDGRNDVWEIKYLATYPGNTVDIFNRYGQKLFSSIGYNVPWDGTYKGSAVPPGTYYYIIDPKNGRKVISGNVTIIR
ncbi:gliding motility-associated C-terminal domain-containing protein [Mucilaginibacter pineti]|uniref:Gliding motility-associated C-terminal domain-containing protein n=1 Tax=Mucilaginibacter pineti TaxID=1391627 RepID=A0A1G6YSZ7_9SPHI|nr:gliding motility-associated C-terminal domain-containing protein [Mucilaginibacter pineti]SDD93470.1 gliding motility-associated C-terminal domain-containing protein [Mucilaginibacter pineti]